MLQPGASLIHLILLVIKKTSFLYKESCSIDVFMLDSRRGTIWNSCIAPCNSESGGDVHRAKSKPCRHAAPCLQVLNRVLSISLVKIWAWRRGSRGNPRYCFFEFQGWWNDHYNLTDHMFSKSILIYIYIYTYTYLFVYIHKQICLAIAYVHRYAGVSSKFTLAQDQATGIFFWMIQMLRILFGKRTLPGSVWN